MRFKGIEKFTLFIEVYAAPLHIGFANIQQQMANWCFSQAGDL